MAFKKMKSDFSGERKEPVARPSLTYRGLEMKTIGQLFPGKEFVMVKPNTEAPFRFLCTSLDDMFEFVPIHFYDGKACLCIGSSLCPMCADGLRVYPRFVCHVQRAQYVTDAEGERFYKYEEEDNIFVTGQALIQAIDGELDRFFLRVRKYGPWWTKVFHFFVKCKKEKKSGLDMLVSRKGHGMHTTYSVKIVGT